MKITFEYTKRDTNLMKEAAVTLAIAMKDQGVIGRDQEQKLIAPMEAMADGNIPETKDLPFGSTKLSTHQEEGRTFVSYELDDPMQEKLVMLLCRHAEPIARVSAALKAVALSLSLFRGIFRERQFQEMKKDFKEYICS